MTNEKNPSLRILIADDHALVRGGFALLVQSIEDNVEVIEANGLEEVESILSVDHEVDLLLLDLSMPGMNGLESIEYICNKWPEVPIIIVSVTEDLNTIRQVLALGVMGYIPKTSTPKITNSAIRLVLSGGIYMPPNLLNSDFSNLSIKKANPTKLNLAAVSSGLTKRQIQVLELVSEGMSNKAIGNQLGLAENTVKMHTSRLFKTLDVENRTEAVAKYSKLKAKYN